MANQNGLKYSASLHSSISLLSQFLIVASVLLLFCSLYNNYYSDAVWNLFRFQVSISHIKLLITLINLVIDYG